jgi:hypothetical protein
MKLGEITVLTFVSTPPCTNNLKCLRLLHHKGTIITCDRTEDCSVLTPRKFVPAYRRFQGPCSFYSRLQETKSKMQLKGTGWTRLNSVFSEQVMWPVNTSKIGKGLKHHNHFSFTLSPNSKTLNMETAGVS